MMTYHGKLAILESNTSKSLSFPIRPIMKEINTRYDYMATVLLTIRRNLLIIYPNNLFVVTRNDNGVQNNKALR